MGSLELNFFVAVTGLPDPRPNHAVAMVRFASECLERFRLLLPKLEVMLGPDTADLAIRAGIHSGPVTAGVLRGERSRCKWRSSLSCFLTGHEF